MIRVGTLEAGGVMAGAALCIRVMGEVGIILAHGYCAVVASGAFPDDVAVIIAAIRIQLQKMIGSVAVVALPVGRGMEFGFADGDDVVMAFTTGAEHLVMIDQVNLVETSRGMAGFAQVAGAGMRHRLAPGNAAIVAGVACSTGDYGIGMID